MNVMVFGSCWIQQLPVLTSSEIGAAQVLRADICITGSMVNLWAAGKLIAGCEKVGAHVVHV